MEAPKGRKSRSRREYRHARALLRCRRKDYDYAAAAAADGSHATTAFNFKRPKFVVIGAHPPVTLLGGAATCSEGFAKYFLRVPRLLGFIAAAMLPKQARGTFRKHVTKPSEQVAAPPSTAAGFRSVLEVLCLFFLLVPLAISVLPGSRVVVVSAHQPGELPRKLLTEPWD